jgi:transposase
MNYNQNEKIAQITSQTLIIGVDIAKFKHVSRAQDYRGMEFGSPCYFDNTIGQGYNSLSSSCFKIKKTTFKCGIKQLDGLPRGTLT